MRTIILHKKNKRLLNIAPHRIIALSFALLILLGTVLLSLPIASRDGESAGFIYAFFTATSAACVTGLVLADTYNHWTLFGQIVILLLIQAGGLGMVTFVTFFTAVFRKKMSLKGMVLAQESISTFTFEGIAKLIKAVILVTLCIEIAGAAILSIRFVPDFGLKGLYIALFHSVSAFCNAGFDLMGIMGVGDNVSLMPYYNSPLVLYTISILIIIGGLGFLVWKDLFDYHKTRSLYLHTKIVLVLTSFFIVTGAVLFFIFESGNPGTMAGLSLPEKINSSIFQSVTCRTAGFNTIPQENMTDISKFISIMLMFIGASPGSTGGGIKVTTFGVLFFAVLSQIRGLDGTILFKRRIPDSTVSRALTIAGFSALIVLTVTTVILAVEGKPFLNVLFEVVSAFGPVGLSTGITPELHPFSKILLAITMFVGRVGPVSVAIALTIRSYNKTTNVVYPEGKVIVG